MQSLGFILVQALSVATDASSVSLSSSTSGAVNVADSRRGSAKRGRAATCSAPEPANSRIKIIKGPIPSLVLRRPDNETLQLIVPLYTHPLFGQVKVEPARFSVGRRWWFKSTEIEPADAKAEFPMGGNPNLFEFTFLPPDEAIPSGAELHPVIQNDDAVVFEWKVAVLANPEAPQ